MSQSTALMERHESTDGDADISAVPDVSALLARAIDRGITPDGLEKLLALKERIDARNAESDAIHALAELQGELPPVKKTRTVPDKNGNAKYHYAALEDVLAHLRPFMSKYGLTVRFNSSLENESFGGPGQTLIRVYQRAECIVTHASGHSWSAYHRAPLDPNAPGNPSQGQIGAAAETYAKRRALMNAFGLATEDEDDDCRLRRELHDAPAANANSPKAQPRGGRVQQDEVDTVKRRWAACFGSGLSKDEMRAEFCRWAFATAGVPNGKADQLSAWSREAIKTCLMALDQEEASIFGGNQNADGE